MSHRIAAAALLVLMAGGAPLAAQNEKGITPIQVAKLSAVRSVHPSPDGQWIAFVRSVPRMADAETPGGSYSNLWILPAGGGDARLLIGGRRSVNGVAWRPDGEAITFLDKREGDRHAEVYALPMAGGEPVRVTRTVRGVRAYKWRPDGKALAYTMQDAPPRARALGWALGIRPVVVDESWTHTSLFFWECERSRSKRLSEGATVFSFEWASDGSKLAAGLAPRPLVDDSYMFVRLHVVDPALSSVKELVGGIAKRGQYAWSPDGSQLAHISGADQRDPHAGMLFVADAASGESRAILPGFKGMFHHLEWIDGGTLLVALSRGVRTSLHRLDLASGELGEALAEPGVAVEGFSRSASGELICASGSSREWPNEVLQLVDGRWQRLTNSNPWLAKVALGRTEVVRYAARDGLEIEGLLMYPVGYEEGERYPMVILAHGGPEAHFVDGWNTSYGRWGQLLTARGWFAWYPNYRASTGYGVEFAKADHGDPMGGEFLDHLDAIALFDERGLIDRARVGLGGGSYGGYTAAWAATRWSEHFAAAVSFVPFVDIRTKWYTSDIPWEFYYVHYEEKWPHEQREFLSARSPLSFAPSCRTPLLILGGTSDPRVHPSQPFMLYRAVKSATETPVRYVQYPGEGHGNRLNVYRYDYSVRCLRWFEHYLRPGATREDPPPPLDLDYSEWAATRRGR